MEISWFRVISDLFMVRGTESWSAPELRAVDGDIDGEDRDQC